MTFTLPAATADSTITHDEYRVLRDMVSQGRPLMLEGRTIRVATFLEMINPRRQNQMRQITDLFTELVAVHQTCNPRDNRRNWLMQAAGLWRDEGGADDLQGTFATAFKYMRLGIQPGDTDEELVNWIYKHHQQHLIAFFGHDLRAHRDQLPFQAANEGTEWRPWEEVKAMLGEHEEFKMDNEFSKCHLGQYGYVAGPAWPNDPRPNDPDLVDSWAEWQPYKQSVHQRWGNQTVLEMRFWMTEESPQMRDNHFYAHLLMKDGRKYSAGEYRPKNFHPTRHPDGFTFTKGSTTFKTHYELPDDSSYQWGAPPLTVKYRFAYPDDQAEASLAAMKELRRKDQSWYRGPSTICDQLYSRVYGLNFDFRMNIWHMLAAHLSQHYTRKVTTLLPEPLQMVGDAVNSIPRVLAPFVPSVCLKAGDFVLRPVENLMSLAIGGGKLDPAVEKFDHPPEPAVTGWFDKRQFAAHPFEADRQIRAKIEEYERQVRAGTAIPPGGDVEAWLALDIHHRVHPYELLLSLTTAPSCPV